MFTHYLTYSFALNFQRECFLARLPDETLRASLHESADRMVRQLADAVAEGADLEIRAKALTVSLLCLRDCRELLERQGPLPHAIRGPYEVLHGRIERLCAEAHAELERAKRLGQRTRRGTA